MVYSEHRNDTALKQNLLKYHKIIQAFGLGIIILVNGIFASPVFAGPEGVPLAQKANTNNAISSTAKNGVVQCGNDDNIRKGTAKAPTGTCTLYDLFDTGIRVVNMLMLLAAIFAVIRIVMAGFSMVLSAGNEERLSAGKSGLTNALLGLFIVLVAYLLINTIFTLLVDNGGSILRNPIDFIKS
jgi:hypothetical protein